MEDNWTVAEHQKFVEGLERYANDEKGWQAITDHVSTKSFNEVKRHAHKYFLKLQEIANTTSQNVEELYPKNGSDSEWTSEEDTLFEQGLRDLGDCNDRWVKISQRIPEKNSEDVKARYQKLLFDIARIEAGENVVIAYKRATYKRPFTLDAVPSTSEDTTTPPSTSSNNDSNTINYQTPSKIPKINTA